MKKVLGIIFATIFFGFLIWWAWNAIFGYSDWLQSGGYKDSRAIDERIYYDLP